MSDHFHQEYYDVIMGCVKEYGLGNGAIFYCNLVREMAMEEYWNANLYVIFRTGEPATITVIETMSFSVPAVGGSNNGSENYICQV